MYMRRTFLVANPMPTDTVLEYDVARYAALCGQSRLTVWLNVDSVPTAVVGLAAKTSKS